MNTKKYCIECDDLFKGEGNLCLRCAKFKEIKKQMSRFSKLFIENDINFKIEDFGDGTGKFFDLGEGIYLNFYEAGRICFEYDKLDFAKQEKVEVKK